MATDHDTQQPQGDATEPDGSTAIDAESADRRRRLRERLPDLAFEVVVIVISVLVALGLNSWRETRAMDRLVDRVEGTIRDEVVQNSEAVRQALEYHEPLLAELRAGRRGERALLVDLAERGIDLEGMANPTALFRRLLEEAGFPPLANLMAIPDGSDGRSYRLVSDVGQMFADVRGDTLEVFVEKPLQLRSAFIRNSAWETAQATETPVHLDYELVTVMSEVFQQQSRYRELSADILERLYDGTTSIPAIEDLTNLERSLIESYDAVLEILDEETAAPRFSADVR